MASSDVWSARNFRRRLFGYDRQEVDHRVQQLQVDRKELERLRESATSPAELGRHLATLLTSFAETVTAEEQRAVDRGAGIVADAEARAAEIEAQARQLLEEARDLAAATFAEAGRRYEAATAAQRTASERIENAIERMADALMSLEAVPDFPELTLPAPVEPMAEQPTLSVLDVVPQPANAGW